MKHWIKKLFGKKITGPTGHLAAIRDRLRQPESSVLLTVGDRAVGQWDGGVEAGGRPKFAPNEASKR